MERLNSYIVWTVLGHVTRKLLHVKWDNDFDKQFEILGLRHKEFAEGMLKTDYCCNDTRAKQSARLHCRPFGVKGVQGYTCGDTMACLWCWCRKIAALGQRVVAASTYPGASGILLVGSDAPVYPDPLQGWSDEQVLHIGDRAISFFGAKYGDAEAISAGVPRSARVLGTTTAQWLDVSPEGFSSSKVCFRRITAIAVGGDARLHPERIRPFYPGKFAAQVVKLYDDPKANRKAIADALGVVLDDAAHVFADLLAKKKNPNYTGLLSSLLLRIRDEEIPVIRTSASRGVCDPQGLAASLAKWKAKNKDEPTEE